jgi:Tetratricopeptide repeat
VLTHARRCNVRGISLLTRSRPKGGHPDSLTTRQDVARMIGRQDRPAEAEQLTRDVLADRRRVLGDDHPDTLTSRAVLAWLAARQGRHAEAEELLRQLLADRNRVLGASHPDTEATRNELAQLMVPRTHADG